MHDERDVETMKGLLLQYIDLLATRNDYGASEGFEYQLWDQLQGHPAQTTLVSFEEGDEIIYLAVYSDSWVTYDIEAGMWRSIDLDDWKELVKKRGH
jgi:hypothetical protein